MPLVAIRPLLLRDYLRIPSLCAFRVLRCRLVCPPHVSTTLALAACAQTSGSVAVLTVGPLEGRRGMGGTLMAGEFEDIMTRYTRR